MIEDTATKNATDTTLGSTPVVIDPIERLSYAPIAQGCIAVQSLKALDPPQNF